MAHEISIENGKAEMAYSGSTPWHGLGTQVDGLQNAQDMLRHAGLLWTVGTAPLFCNSVELEAHRAVVRGDNGRVLGVVTNRYVPIQNTQAADVVDALVTEGGAHVEVAGALGQGERCWMLAHIPGDFEVVKGDQVRPYFLLAWGHDGKHGLAGKLTTIRVVCNNTLTAAGFGRGKWSRSASIYVKHTRNAKVQIEAARTALGIAKRQVEDTAEAYRQLAAKPLVDPTGYFSQVFPQPEEATVRGPRNEAPNAATHAELYESALARWNAHQEQLLSLFESGQGSEIPGVRGTAWAGYNAVTEYLDHVYPVLKSGEVSPTRQQSVLFGSYDETRQSALELALAL